ncbi:MAG: MucBP domain-containing protein [Lachnospiraceae bacterium]|nr:MucBP domain-containing protein [Lachnospiraceae bacterium]
MNKLKRFIAASMASLMALASAAVSIPAATEDPVINTVRRVSSYYDKACEDTDSQYIYDGFLGCKYTKDSSEFRVWAPAATDVKVNLYTTGTDDEENARKVGTYVLEKMLVNGEWNGVWTIRLIGGFKNWYYTYTITTYNITNSYKSYNTYETPDLYAVAASKDGNRSLITDLENTDPSSWDLDNHVYVQNPAEAIVYELDIKNFTSDSSSGIPNDLMGKFLSFTQRSTLYDSAGISTCTNYLERLGVTTVQIKPFYSSMGFMMPDNSYSTNESDPLQTVSDCKNMIRSLHKAGLSVVMDMDITSVSEDFPFQKTVPDYYIRMKTTGDKSNGSGNGNDCATERLMFRRYIIDTLTQWVNEYHVDGFHFENGGLIDQEFLNEIREELNKISPDISISCDTVLPYLDDAVITYNTCRGKKLNLVSLDNVKNADDGISFYNSTYSNNIMSYINGGKNMSDAIQTGILADKDNKLTKPAQCTNYLHDNSGLSLYDRITDSLGIARGTKDDNAIALAKLAVAMEYTSMGSIVIRSGDEMGYSSSQSSALDWNNLITYSDLYAYYSGLIQLRKTISKLTSGSTSSYSDFVFDTNSTDQIAYVINNGGNNEWNKIAVMYNNSDSAKWITLSDTSTDKWVIVANNEDAGFETLKIVSGNSFYVPAHTAIIAADAESYYNTDVVSDMRSITFKYVDENGKELKTADVLRGRPLRNYNFTSLPHSIKNYTLVSMDGEASGMYYDTDKVITCHYQNAFDGLEAGGVYCSSVRFKVLNPDDVVSVDYGNGITATYLTCDKDGYYTVTPLRTKDPIEVSILYKDGSYASIHIIANDDRTPAPDDGDCTTPIHCSVCDEILTPAKKHVMSDWKVAADGSHTRHCTNADCNYSESINHDLTHVAAKAATTKSEGNIEYWHCSICGKYFSDAKATKEITAAQTITARLTDDSGSNQPSDDKPSNDKPSNDKPSQDKPSNDKPSQDNPSDVPPATGCHTDIALLIVMLMVSALAATDAGTVRRKKRA